MTSHSSMNPPSVVVTVIVAVPGEIAVTRPFSSTVAAALLDDQAIDLSVASAGETSAVNCAVPPVAIDRLFSLSETPVTGTVSASMQPN